jgi:hypothetical protein
MEGDADERDQRSARPDGAARSVKDGNEHATNDRGAAAGFAAIGQR